MALAAVTLLGACTKLVVTPGGEKDAGDTSPDLTITLPPDLSTPPPDAAVPIDQAQPADLTAPPDQLCNGANCLCANDSSCGTGFRCCPGAGTTKVCTAGDCCTSADCPGGLGCDTNHTCRALCSGSGTGCQSGQTCCNSYCYDGNCCSNSDCPGGQACIANRCVSCTSDAQCTDGQICAGGQCQPGCRQSASCGSGSLCCDQASPFTQCRDASCAGQCTAGTCCTAADCSGGQICAGNQCRTTCSSEAQCGAGGHCCGGLCYNEACVTTLAGSGLRGAPDAPIASAYINAVYGVLPDDKGNVFFTDLRSGSVRVLNNGTTSIGSVLPGTVGRLVSGIYGCKPGPAQQAEMEEPIALARDTQGNLYVSDQGCAVIWKLSADYQTVSLFAGQPGNRGTTDGQGSNALLHLPRGLTFGVDGFLYVSDYQTHRIRRVSLTGDVRTVAGSGTAGEVDGPALQAQFTNPSALVQDSAGTLFVADYPTGTVRMITGLAQNNAQVTTIVPLGANGKPLYGNAGFGSIGLVAGKLYVPFWPNGIWALSPPSNGGTVYSATKLTAAGGITLGIDPGGNSLWLGGWESAGSALDQTLSQWTLSGNQVQTIGQPKIVGIVDGPGPNATFTFPNCALHAITVDGDGNTWVADGCANRIRKVAPDGRVSSFGTGAFGEVGGTASQARFCYPSAITAVGKDIYVANRYCDHRVMKIDGASANVSVLNSIYTPSDPGLIYASAPAGLVADANGNLYLTVNEIYFPTTNSSSRFAVVIRIPNLGSGTPSYFAGTPTPGATGCADGPLGTGRFGADPYGMAIDSSGYLYVADVQCGIRRVAPTGVISTLAGGFAPVGIALGPVQNGQQVLYASRSDNAIVTIDRITGTITPWAGASISFNGHFADGPLNKAQFWAPYSLATGPTGNLHVLDRNNNRIRIVYPQ